MAYNLAQFNLTSFNAGSKVKWISARFAESVFATIGATNDTYLNIICNERVDKSIDGAVCKFIPASGAEAVDELVSGMISVIWVQPKSTEIVDAEVLPSAEVFLTMEFNEEIIADVLLSQEAFLDTQFAEDIEADTSLGVNLYLETAGYELISESASVVAIEETICYIGTPNNPFTLKPGERLVIDAGTYNLLLNGENIIEYHSGEWLDSMNRNTLNIDISASSGLSNLTATILYTELFL